MPRYIPTFNPGCPLSCPDHAPFLHCPPSSPQSKLHPHPLDSPVASFNFPMSPQLLHSTVACGLPFPILFPCFLASHSCISLLMSYLDLQIDSFSISVLVSFLPAWIAVCAVRRIASYPSSTSPHLNVTPLHIYLFLVANSHLSSCHHIN